MTTGIENDEDTPVRSNAFREQQERDYEVMFGKTMTTETSTEITFAELAAQIEAGLFDDELEALREVISERLRHRDD